MNLPRFALCLIAGWSGCMPALADDARGLDRAFVVPGRRPRCFGPWPRSGTVPLGVDFSAPGPNGEPNGAARFDGRKAYIEVPAAKSPALGTQEFSLAVRVHTAEALERRARRHRVALRPHHPPRVQLRGRPQRGRDHKSRQLPARTVRHRQRTTRVRMDRPRPAGERRDGLLVASP